MIKFGAGLLAGVMIGHTVTVVIGLLKFGEMVEDLEL